MKFAIEEFATAKLNSVNLRSEVHGEKHVPAVDLSFTQDVPNTVLSYFDGALLSALYYCSAASGEQLTEKVFGKLASLIQQEVKIQLTPPQAPVSDEKPPMPTSAADVGRELFGDKPDDETGSNPKTPLDAMQKAHGVGEHAAAE